MVLERIIPLIMGILCAPLLQGVINKVKAFFAGRKGVPVLQLYYDIFKLLRKTPVYSETVTWIFSAGPVMGLASVLTAMIVVPFGSYKPLISFPGDFLFMLYLLGLMRFLTMSAALDTGSSFEGMGASREASFSAFAEPVLLFGIAAVAAQSRSYALAEMLPVFKWQGGIPAALIPIVLLVGAAFVVIMLVENSRIPVDDPNTHLELTMIHEVMVLDHSGPDFAFILYGAALKLWLFGMILIGILIPGMKNPLTDIIVSISGMICIGIGIGIVESTMARLRLVKIPQLIVGAGTFALFALILTLRQYL